MVIKGKVVPTIKVGDCLLVPIQIDLDDKTVEQLQIQLLREIQEQRVRAIILDVRMVEVIDSYISYTLSETATMARLMGCQTVICGIQPPVALTLAQMGINLNGLLVARDLEHALCLVYSPERGVGELGQQTKRAAKHSA